MPDGGATNARPASDPGRRVRWVDGSKCAEAAKGEGGCGQLLAVRQRTCPAAPAAAAPADSAARSARELCPGPAPAANHTTDDDARRHHGMRSTSPHAQICIYRQLATMRKNTWINGKTGPTLAP